MTTNPSRSLRLAILLLVLLASIAPAQAQSGWRIRGEGAWVRSDLHFSETDFEGNRTTATAADGFGLGLALEYRISPRFGLDLGLLFASSPVRISLSNDAAGVRITDRDDLSVRPLTVAFDFHLTPDHPVDVFVSPVVAYVAYGDLTFRAVLEGVEIDRLQLAVDDDFAYGGRLGVELPFGDGPWSVRATALYLVSELAVEDPDGDREELDFDPLIVTAGIGYRF